MKKVTLLPTLRCKVRLQAELLSNQSRDAKLLFPLPCSCLILSEKPCLKLFLFSSKASSLHGNKRKHITRKHNSSLVSLHAQDYRMLTLRSYALFSGKQTRYKMIRPLLDFKRESITMICKDLSFSVYPDKSNRLLQYSRNRVRKQILPSIKYFLNPQVENSLFKTAELLKKEQSLCYSVLKTSLGKGEL